ncbi:MAG: 2TM domain-containing protein [Alphaproteobacteria bacterium]|nr:2TM domain-containing protein [Alphaproteobacteria bacterium]
MRRYQEADPVLVRNEVRHFKHHLMSYVLVVAMLAGINILSGGFWQGNWWFLWVALFWGVGLGFHALRLFGDDFGRGWEDRMVAHVVARRSGQGSSAPDGSGARGGYTPPQPPRSGISAPGADIRGAGPSGGGDGYVPPKPPTP